jgi:hypothetical protein
MTGLRTASPVIADLITALKPGIAGGRIGLAIPNAPTWPWVLLVRAGGLELESGVAWRDAIDVHCLAASIGDAETLAAATERALLDLAGTTIGTTVLTAVQTFNRPRWLPDTSYLPPQPRLVFSVAVTHHPTS